MRIDEAIKFAEHAQTMTDIPEVKEFYAMAEKALRTQNQVNWVSVNDRLPEDEQDVLCWYEYFRYGNYNRMYQAYGIGYCIDGNWSGEAATGTKAKVLAWMPLPEPPKE